MALADSMRMGRVLCASHCSRGNAGARLPPQWFSLTDPSRALQCAPLAPQLSAAFQINPTQQSRCVLSATRDMSLPSGNYLHHHAGVQRNPRKHQRSRCTTVSKASESQYVGSLTANNLKFALVVARFNDLITRPLLQGALEAFERHGGDTSKTDVSHCIYKSVRYVCSTD